jgi:hypothetical protein
MQTFNVERILLIEPKYRNKYPPLGLMKISTYHKKRGDYVVFYKGCSPELRNMKWDRIYIATLFTFYWNETIKTIKYYSKCIKDPSLIFVGGVMATMMKDDIRKIVPVTIISGLLNQKGLLGYEDDDSIDCITPDYSIIDPKTNPWLTYSYPTSNSYIAYATRGCIRKCPFCAVPYIEPEFSNNLSISNQVNAIKNIYGEKKDLLLLDNNILASEKFPEIIEEIKSLGFIKGSTFTSNNSKRDHRIKRFVDFNQGIDARLLTREKMELLSQIAIKPLRIAFDDIKYKDIYIEKIRLAAEFGIKTLSNYILFNYNDSPEDFYERLKINIDLNEEFSKEGLKSQIWSFPMKYSPITGEFCRNRKFIGDNWNKKYLRAIQCILLTTHGVVGPKRQFFEKAFGKNFNEFISILLLPEKYIIYRNHNTENGNISTYYKKVEHLNKKQKEELLKIVTTNNFENFYETELDEEVSDILNLYMTN